MLYRIARSSIVSDVKPYQLIAALMQAKGLGSLSLANALGLPKLQAPIHRYINGKVPSPRNSTARPIADFFEIPLEALYDEDVATEIAARLGISGRGTSIEESATNQSAVTPRTWAGVAHLKSRLLPTLTPSLLWGEIVPDSLPDVFTVSLPDDSMAPDAPAGTVVTFSRKNAASSGDGVLVTDRDGGLYFREYRARTATAWQAAPKNPAFLPLDSQADGLVVLAVMSHISKAGSKI